MVRRTIRTVVLVALLATAIAVPTSGVLAVAPAHAVSFNLCGSWSGWRYGGDGFDYLSSSRIRFSSTQYYHYYYKRSVLNGTTNLWRIICNG